MLEVVFPLFLSREYVLESVLSSFFYLFFFIFFSVIFVLIIISLFFIFFFILVCFYPLVRRNELYVKGKGGKKDFNKIHDKLTRRHFSSCFNCSVLLLFSFFLFLSYYYFLGNVGG